MNERIKELAEQAREYAHEQAAMMDNTYLRAFEEKFAELLIKDCATAIAQDQRLNDVRSAANGCMRTIREHFGVEE